MDGKRRATPSRISSGNIDVDARSRRPITIRGKLGWAKTKQMTTFNLVVLRVLMFTVGRFFPDLIRKLLQRLLITGKKSAPLQFTRTLAWEGDRLRVIDELTTPSWDKVSAVGHRRARRPRSTW